MFYMISEADDSGYYEVCTEFAKDQTFPQTIIWGFPLQSKLANELPVILEYCKDFSSKYLSIKDLVLKTDYGTKKTEEICLIFKGEYASYPQYLLEVSFLRVLSADSSEGYEYQNWIRSVMLKGKRNLSDFFNKDYQNYLFGAGHSPFTEIDLQKAELTIDEYLAPTRITGLIPHSYMNNCLNTYKAAIKLKQDT